MDTFKYLDQEEKDALLFEAAGKIGEARRVELLIQAGANVNAKRSYGWSTLMRAAGINGDAHIVVLLIQAGADVNARDEDGWTALMVAAGYGDAERVRLLIQAGADVNARKNVGAGITALMMAAGYGDAERVRLLIQARADVNATNKNGESALDIARRWKKQDAVAFLQQHRLSGGAQGLLRHVDGVKSDSSAENTIPSAPVINSLQAATRATTSARIPLPGSAGRKQETGSTSHPGTASDFSVRGQLIHNSELARQEELGKGSFGTVYRALWNGSVEVAVKIFGAMDPVLRSPLWDQVFQSVFEQFVIPEVDLLSTLRHPFVVQCYGCCKDPPSIVMELCPMGSLSHVLNQCLRDEDGLGARMTWRRRLCMARQIASALQYLHGHRVRGGVLHRDLRSMNVVITRDWTAKVTDVGMSRFVDQVSSRSAGTLHHGSNPRWMAPEILRNQPFTEASDVYGLGTILWEMMVWHHPWENLELTAQVVFARLSSDLEVPREQEWDRLPGPRPLHHDTLPRFASLTCRCLSVDPSSRPPISEIVSLLMELEYQEPSTTESEASAANSTPPQPSQQQGRQLCCICLERIPTKLMSGCLHLCLCDGCSDRESFTECPICKTTGVPQQVYFP